LSTTAKDGARSCQFRSPVTSHHFRHQLALATKRMYLDQALCIAKICSRPARILHELERIHRLAQAARYVLTTI
jgi:hypothetical protein